MKEILLNLTTIVISVLIFIYYEWNSKTRYGLRSSISGSAKDHQKDGNTYKTFLFVIIGLTGSVMYLGQSSIFLIIGSVLMSAIAGFTGYNPKLKNKKAQDILHVGFTLSSMAFYTIGMVTFNLEGGYKVNILYSVITGLWLIYVLDQYSRKTYQHTRKIEKCGYYALMLVFLIETVLCPFI